MLKIGVIGLGGCGNRIAKLAAEEEFPALAINSAEVDCEDIDSFEVLLLGDSGGCGKDRKLGQKIFKQKYKDIEGKLAEFTDNDIVVCVASADGGTGGAMLPLIINVMKELHKGPVYVPIVVLPFKTEGVSSQKNAIRCMKEISELDVSYRVYDNDRTLLTTSSMIEAHELVNKTIIEDLKVLRGDICPASPYGNMDDRDRLKIAATKGLSIISKTAGIKENHLDSSSISDYIVDAIKQSCNVDIERDKFVSRMGFIYSLPESMIKRIDKQYVAIKDYAGEPLEIFEHINVLNEESGSVIAILSGLSDPNTRISEMLEIVDEREKKALSRRKGIDLNLDDDEDDCDLSDNNKSSSKSIEDIFGDY